MLKNDKQQKKDAREIMGKLQRQYTKIESSAKEGTIDMELRLK